MVMSKGNLRYYPPQNRDFAKEGNDNTRSSQRKFDFRAKKRRETTRFSSRSCALGGGIHRVWIKHGKEKMLCPGDLVHGLNQTNNQLDSCSRIKQKHFADGTCCQWKDEVYNCVCGGLNHSTGHHETFEEQMKEQGIIGLWPLVIFQKCIDQPSGKSICMTAEKNRGGCILPEHEDECPAPEHLSWVDIDRSVATGELAEKGFLRRNYEECYSHCVIMKEGTMDLDEYVNAYLSLAPGLAGEFDRTEEIAEEEQSKKMPITHLALKTIPTRSGKAIQSEKTRIKHLELKTIPARSGQASR